ncbi:uncharacterized protein JN550_012909 [Neoarthrinium moseri]|uniref:uncharacterized protein n=1 Tax=Neoarthrinium moseri TaxID=1658444 RepID=UPI001FDDB402|nr:uncharacterized protein JN550_012909 [Neoarthrinium moseri]KAI1858016.1 hypothetical protein JN550_012909 [Neoarthrinium moseri]
MTRRSDGKVGIWTDFVTSLESAASVLASGSFRHTWIVQPPWLHPEVNCDYTAVTSTGILNTITSLYGHVITGRLSLSMFQILEKLIGDCKVLQESIIDNAFHLLIETATDKIGTDGIDSEMFLIGLYQFAVQANSLWPFLSRKPVIALQKKLEPRLSWELLCGPMAHDDTASLAALCERQGIYDNEFQRGLFLNLDRFMFIDLELRTVRLISPMRVTFSDLTARLLAPNRDDDIVWPIKSAQDLGWWLQNGNQVESLVQLSK